MSFASARKFYLCLLLSGCMDGLCFLLSISLASMSLLWSFTAKEQFSQGLLFIHTWEGSGLVNLVNCRHFLKRFCIVYFLFLWSFPTGWSVLSSPGTCCFFFCLFVNMLSSSIKLFPFPWKSYDLKTFPPRWKVLNSEEDLLETGSSVLFTQTSNSQSSCLCFWMLGL